MNEHSAPIDESTPAASERREHLLRIGQRTQFQLGNQRRRIYPKPIDENDPTVAAELHRRLEQHTADLGGRDILTEAEIRRITRFVYLELFLETWEAYFLRAGIVTRQGRVRSGFTTGYLATLTQLMRLGQIIGLSRVPRESTLSTRQWLERAAEAEANAEPVPETEAGTHNDGSDTTTLRED
jgi:hypothetical protein